MADDTAPANVQMDMPGAGYASLNIDSDRRISPAISSYLFTPDELVALAHHILSEFEIHVS